MTAIRQHSSQNRIGGSSEFLRSSVVRDPISERLSPMTARWTGFEFDPTASQLEAQVCIVPAGGDSYRSDAGDELLQQLERRIADLVVHSSDLARYSIKLSRCDDSIVLSWSFPIEQLTFRDVLFSLRRIERLAERLAATLVAEPTEPVQRASPQPLATTQAETHYEHCA